MSSDVIEILGNFDGVDANGILSGWAWSPSEPGTRRQLIIFADGEPAGLCVADQFRDDLAAMGYGDGAHGFKVAAPTVHGGAVVYSVRDAASGRQIGSDIAIDTRELPSAGLRSAAEGARRLQGNLDDLSADGRVSGWCWNPSDAAERVDLVVLIDGFEVGRTTAAGYRPDLEQAGIGDGRHGFSYFIPAPVMLQRGEITVAVADALGGAPVGRPIGKRIGDSAPVDDRIADLERQLLVLRRELDASTRRMLASDEDRAARDLFRMVATFFQELADAPVADGFAAIGLRRRVADFAARFAPIGLAVPSRRDATIVVEARDPADSIYQALVSLVATGADSRADVVLVDDGVADGETALLPTVVRNLRYHRVAAGGTFIAARNEIAAASASPVVVFLSSGVAGREGWLDALLATLDEEPAAAIVAARIVRADGSVESAGLSVGADAIARPAGHASDGAARTLRRVDAVAEGAYAVRAAVFRGAGGFAADFVTSDAAAVDLCLALQAAGQSVLVQPAATLERRRSEERAVGMPRDDEFVLSERNSQYLRSRRQSSPRVALFVDTAMPSPDASLLANRMRSLRDLGWRVVFACEQPDEAGNCDSVRSLEARGIEVARPFRPGNVAEVVRVLGDAVELVMIDRAANPQALIGDIRSCADDARYVLAPSRPGAEIVAPKGRRPANAARRDVKHSIAAAAPADETHVASDDSLPWACRPRRASPQTAERNGIAIACSPLDAASLEAVEWFLAAVFPAILAARPDTTLTIASRAASPSIPDGVQRNVRRLDSDIAETLAGVLALVVPLRRAAGFRGEMVFGMEIGVPVVASSHAAAGSGVAPVAGVAIADDAAEFAAAVLVVLASGPAWAALSRSATAAAQALFPADRAAAAWRALGARLGVGFDVE